MAGPATRKERADWAAHEVEAANRDLRDARSLPFGQLLRAFRLRAQKSQELVSEAMDIHPHHVSLMESGKRRPSIERVGQIKDVLGLSPDEVSLLVDAAARARKQFRLKAGLSREHDVLAVRLLRTWDSLTRDEVQALLRVLGGAV
ncbi:helix-turn-helix domain-containing protein [Corallococcus sp. AS-1-6]|uniref:helix-turn-helix domain-containing protein n=1 Tax=Corallococcus sp. AS-1-6 TaxID=2874599 RepID=UPI001CBBE265|nr:helix-turn-helix transcriptional regulator [Corallococcus sp. AS-1-6]MBZ4371461.1 helix-turn-helix domain-containing protein [Corallococcus sp. AS-1-6]